MKLRALLTAVGLLATVQWPAMAAGPLSDLVSPEKRKTSIELAQRLTRTPEPAPLPAKLAQPFSPPGFDQPDPAELRAAAAAAAKAGAAAPGAGPDQPAHQPGDREVLESLAAKLPATGTLVFGGTSQLIIGKNRFVVGDRFTVTDRAKGQDYELELVAIASTTFTLRYHSEEITRPIKSGKSQ